MNCAIMQAHKTQFSTHVDGEGGEDENSIKNVDKISISITPQPQKKRNHIDF